MGNDEFIIAEQSRNDSTADSQLVKSEASADFNRVFDLKHVRQSIADAVTVLAENAAQADAAATIIANAVNLSDHPGVVRVPAHDLAPDSDLGNLPVTQDVPPLSVDAIEEALNDPSPTCSIEDLEADLKKLSGSHAKAA